MFVVTNKYGDVIAVCATAEEAIAIQRKYALEDVA